MTRSQVYLACLALIVAASIGWALGIASSERINTAAAKQYTWEITQYQVVVERERYANETAALQADHAAAVARLDSRIANLRWMLSAQGVLWDDTVARIR